MNGVCQLTKNIQMQNMIFRFLAKIVSFSLLDAVMLEDVMLPADDDVTVLNRPVQTKYYTTPPIKEHHPQRDYDF